MMSNGKLVVSIETSNWTGGQRGFYHEHERPPGTPGGGLIEDGALRSVSAPMVPGTVIRGFRISPIVLPVQHGSGLQ